MTICDRTKCTGCSACANICRQRCISMQPDMEGFLYPEIDQASCVECGMCRSVCPVNHVCMVEQRDIIAVAAQSLDDKVRYAATSGGVFYHLAEYVIQQGGAVFGAVYDMEYQVRHEKAESLDELQAMHGAKYTQSRIGDVYIQAENDLKSGRLVLFSGTPCQIEGLHHYLRRDYDNLILVDLVCHGVPAPEVWRSYISYRSTIDQSVVKTINLRSKETGWPGYSVHFQYEESSYLALSNQDPYMRAFIGNLCLRESCYSCDRKGSNRHSDITLGDYWGIWSQLPEYHDGKGTSIVILSTEKAHAIWHMISYKLKATRVNAEHCFDENQSALLPSARPVKHDEFMQRYKAEDFEQLVDELIPKPLPGKKPSLLHRVVKGAVARIKRA